MAAGPESISAEFPYPTIRVPGSEALAVWERMRSEGGTPVIVGGEEDLEFVAEQVQWQSDRGELPASVLAQAEGFVFPDDYRARLIREQAEFEERLRQDAKLHNLVDNLSSAGFELDSEPQHSEWPVEPPDNLGLTVDTEFVAEGKNYFYRTRDEVIIAILPTQDWTEAFAYVGYGNWNACPPPHEHVAAFRYWTAKYDLELVGMSGDVLNLRARRSPETREEALILAREQYDFCNDIVDQGIPLEELAAGLMAGNWWYFWWD